MEARRRRAASSAETRRKKLYSLLALAGDYLKYLFTKRGRLLGRVARRSLALALSSGGARHSGKQYLAPAASAAPWPPCALAEHEFSCRNSPSPAFLAARRLRSRLKRGASSSCFGALRAPCGCGSSPVTEAAGQDAAEEDEEEVDGGCACGMELDVDYRAEEFINMFYEQLRAQSFQTAVFQCRLP